MKVSLAGKWLLSKNGEQPIEGHLPGCNYLDYIANGMDDPFYGTNENKAKSLGRADYTYERTIDLSEDFLSKDHVKLTADGIDTVCDLFINGKFLGHSENINRTYRFDASGLLKTGTNTVTLKFKDPYKFAEQEQEKDHYITGKGSTKTFIRKTPCHFGWDWGPELAPTGVTRYIGLEAYNNRIDSVNIRQSHHDGCVDLTVSIKADAIDQMSTACVEMTDPDGNVSRYPLQQKGSRYSGTITIKEPKLWWPNGMGEQNLYLLKFTLQKKTEDGLSDEAGFDQVVKEIGLRTITLDTSKDEDGEQFKFIVNGVPIFAKGCDWIPGDSFITRFTREDAEFYIRSCRDANMNMLRVWGGGTYESEDFYDLCDKYGILIWQDCVFACNVYPFYNKDFLHNVHLEIRDNLRRIRHRACLALLCANNENEIFMELNKSDKVRKSNKIFYHETLRKWAAKYAPDTVFWPGSPSSGHIDVGIHHFEKGRLSGDSHLWNIWHGMKEIEDYKNYLTRFCSEFGLESMPAYKTILSFNPEKEPSLFDDTMLVHQKSVGGNSKMLWYLLQKYKNPKHFKDFVYLTQIVQSNAMRYATECWKRNIGKQNGALMWQLNDCWPVASWAIIDYNKQWKATMYGARSFNKTLMISNDYYDDRFELYVINERNQAYKGTLSWSMITFDGNVEAVGSVPVDMEPIKSELVTTVHFDQYLKPSEYGKVYFKAELLLEGEDEPEDTKLYLLVADKKASLKKPSIKRNVTLNDDIMTVSLQADTYARYVYVDSKLVRDNFSDNFFDMEPGREYRITVKVPEDRSEELTAEQLGQSLDITTLAGCESTGNAWSDRILMQKMFWKDKNYVTRFLYDPMTKRLARLGDRKMK